jgi:magnesium-transporting ATPase (P-type)
MFEVDIIALGIVAFENKLKVDTRSTIDKLVESDIEPKMITGDNIFIAVETGFRAGILKEGEKVVLFEGRKQTNYGKGEYEGLLLFKQDG